MEHGDQPLAQARDLLPPLRVLIADGVALLALLVRADPAVERRPQRAPIGGDGAERGLLLGVLLHGSARHHRSNVSINPAHRRPSGSSTSLVVTGGSSGSGVRSGTRECRRAWRGRLASGSVGSAAARPPTGQCRAASSPWLWRAASG